MLLKDLQKLGFTKNLSTIYLTLFNLGQAKAGEIVRSTGMHRNLVYNALDTLEDKKLITKIKTNGVALYKVLDPLRLLGEVEEKKKIAEDIIDELKNKQQVNSQEIVVYEGKKEIQKKYKELYTTLTKDDFWYILGLSPKYFEINGKKLVEEFTSIQKKRKINIKGIGGFLDENEKKYIEKTGGFSKFKVIQDISRKDSEVNIVNDRVLIMIFSKPYTVIEIFNKDLVQSYKEYFEFLWSQDVSIQTGKNVLNGVFYEMLNELKKGEEYYVLGATTGNNIEKTNVFFDKFHDERIKKGVKTNMIIFNESFDILKNRFIKLGDVGLKLSNIKKLSSNSHQPFQINLYKNKTRIILYGDEPSVIYFDKPEIYNGFKDYFDYLWKQEVKTYSGWDEVEKLFFNYLLPLQKEGDIEYNFGGGYGETGQDEKVLDFYLRYNRERTKRKIHKKIMFYEKHREESKKEMQDAGDINFDFVEMKYLPDEYYSAMQTHLIADKAVIIIWGEKPVATLYENKKIVESFKKQFDILWKNSVV